MMARGRYRIFLLVLFLVVAGILIGCGGSGSGNGSSDSIVIEGVTLNRFEGAMIGRNADGVVIDAISYHLFRIDMEGNVIWCDEDSDIIDTDQYFYFVCQTGDGKDPDRVFPFDEEYTVLFTAFAALFGTEDDEDHLFKFLSTYEVKPDVLYQIYSENTDRLEEIVLLWKYLFDHYLALDANQDYDVEDIVDFLSYNEIKLSDFPTDAYSYFEMLKNNNISFDEFINLFFETGDFASASATGLSATTATQTSGTKKQKLLAVQNLIQSKQTATAAQTVSASGTTVNSSSIGSFILSKLADIGIDTLVDIIKDLITGTPTQLTNFKEQPIECYAKTATGGTDKASRYYSPGTVVKTDPSSYTYTQGALWWYNQLNFTLQIIGTIKNIYDGDHDGIDDGDIAGWGVFGRQITVAGTNVSANRVHDIEYKLKILYKGSESIAVAAGAIDPADDHYAGLPSVDISLTSGHTPVKFRISGEIVITWKNRGFVGQAWQTDECRFKRYVHVDTMSGVAFDYALGTPTSVTLPIKYPCTTHWNQSWCKK